MSKSRAPLKVVLATGNAGKLREFADLLADPSLDLVSQSSLGIDAVEETGDSFVANALLKARHAAAQSGLPAIADDSGLEVDALGGAPGVRSARYAGEAADDRANLEKLLQTMRGRAADDRRARFRCVIVFVRSADDPEPLIGTGSWEGRLLFEPRGSGGFGYDPIFAPIDLDPSGPSSVAELSPQQKNSRSHRALALRELRARWPASGSP